MLIDGGAELNICTLNLIKYLGYSQYHIDPTKRINFKAYDNEERSSKGIVILLVRVRIVTIDITFQVLDQECGYNMLLGRPWIHAMQAMPSDFHQYVKFPYNSIEITIHGDPNPFQHCKYLRASTDNQVPINQATPLTMQMESLKISNMPASSSCTPSTPPLQIKDEGCDDYSCCGTLSVRQLSPRSFGRALPNPSNKNKGKGIVQFSYSFSFIRWGELNEESLEEYVNNWLYKEESDNPSVKLPLEQYGNGFKMLQ